jgi:hypothetical protein
MKEKRTVYRGLVRNNAGEGFNPKPFRLEFAIVYSATTPKLRDISLVFSNKISTEYIRVCLKDRNREKRDGGSGRRKSVDERLEVNNHGNSEREEEIL